MKTDNLKSSVRALKSLRDVSYSQLDVSVQKQLDEVITELETACDAEAEEVNVDATAVRTLEILGAVVGIVANVTELAKAFFTK